VTERQRLEAELLATENARMLANVEFELHFERLVAAERDFATAAERLRAHVARESGPS
jgi:hypothetical protein